MSAEIWNCAELAAKVKDEAKQLIEEQSNSKTLEIISVGYDPASEVYMRGKKKDCESGDSRSWRRRAHDAGDVNAEPSSNWTIRNRFFTVKTRGEAVMTSPPSMQGLTSLVRFPRES